MPLSVPIFYGIAGPAGLPAAAVAAWDELAREMVNTGGFKELLGKLKSQPSYLGSREFTNSVVNVYQAMGKLAPELGLGKR